MRQLVLSLRRQYGQTIARHCDCRCQMQKNMAVARELRWPFIGNQRACFSGQSAVRGRDKQVKPVISGRYSDSYCVTSLHCCAIYAALHSCNMHLILN